MKIKSKTRKMMTTALMMGLIMGALSNTGGGVYAAENNETSVEDGIVVNNSEVCSDNIELSYRNDESNPYTSICLEESEDLVETDEIDVANDSSAESVENIREKFETANKQKTEVTIEDGYTGEKSGTTQDGFTYENNVVTGYVGTDTEITIPQYINNIEINTIGKNAFKDNALITSVTIPSTINKIEERAFFGCTGLKELTINATNLADSSSDNTKSGNIWQPFYNAGALSGMTVTFGEGVRRIPGYLFATGDYEGKGVYCKVSSVVISSSVKEVGPYAFYSCLDLTSIDGGEGLTEIKKGAFYKTSLNTLPNLNKVTTIGDSAFREVTSMTKAVIGESVTLIDERAFFGCTGLKELTINATNLADSSSDNTKSGNIWQPFYNAGALSGMTVTFGEGVRRIPGYLFATGDSEGKGIYCKVSRVSIPSSVKEVGPYAFFSCLDLTSIDGGEGLTEIKKGAFYKTSLNTLPNLNKVTTIGDSAFREVTSMTKAVIGESVTKIGERAFWGCTGLKELTINATNLADSSSDNVLQNTSQPFYNVGALSGMTVTFGEGVKRVPAYLFATGFDEGKEVYCRIKKVDIPATVSKMGSNAFANCFMLEEIRFHGNAPESFGDNTFLNVTATAYYPSKSSGWNNRTKQNYGGTITWLSDSGKEEIEDGANCIIVSGQKINLRETCFADVTDSISRYYVNDKSVASVSKEMLTGKKPGKVIVYAQKMVNRNIYEDIAKSEVTILSKPKLSFTKNMTYAEQTINGADYFSTGDIRNIGATYWESSKPQIVEVTDSERGILKAGYSGTAKITAYFGEKGKTGTYKVSANLTVKTPSFIKTDYTLQTGAKLTLSMKNVTGVLDPKWITSDESIAKATAQVNNKGIKTGKVIIDGFAFGDTNLTANIEGQKYDCVIHVTAPEINKKTMTLGMGKTGIVSLKKTKIKKNEIVWKSENPAVATIDENGRIMAISPGTAVVYTESGGKRNECVVTVRQ